MATEQTPGNAKRYALIAIAVLLVSEVVFSCLHILRGRMPGIESVLLIPIAAIVLNWAAPLLIAYKVERRGVRSLGLAVKRENYLRYALYAAIGLVLPAVFVGVDRDLLVEFAEQIVYIGVAEELFSRGYLMTRLCEWLGNRNGLLLSALIFGLGHVTSRLSQHGFRYPLHDLTLFAEMAVGGLILGAIYLRSKTIVPGTILHVAANLYLSRVTAF